MQVRICMQVAFSTRLLKLETSAFNFFKFLYCIMYFLSSTKSWNALPGKIVLITHLLICSKNLLRDLYLTALCLVNSVSSVVIVFLLWFHNTSRGYQNPMSFYQSLLTTSKETINIASRGHCIGRDRTRIKLQFSRTAGNSHILKMATVVHSNCAA